MTSQVAPSFLEHLKKTNLNLYNALVAEVNIFDKQEKPVYELLINGTHGGYGFSDAFVSEFNAEHGTEYKNSDFSYENTVKRHDPRLIKTYKRLYRRMHVKYNKQWNGSSANVAIRTIKNNRYSMAK